MKILAIDPGNEYSGYAIIEMPEFKLVSFGKEHNDEILCMVSHPCDHNADAIAIEMIASYGMPVGKDVFDTCLWIGRFYERILQKEKVQFVYRKDEKIALCGSTKAKDSNVKQALIDRYATHDFKTGKGTKKDPDTFYGVTADAWQAIAVGVTYYENNFA